MKGEKVPMGEVNREKRRRLVADFFFKGYTPQMISEALEANGVEVSRRTLGNDLRLLRHKVKTKRVENIDYRKNKYLRALDQIRSDAWILRERFTKQPSACFASHRVGISALELQAKIDGVITEKIPGGQDKAILELQKELKSIEEKARSAKGDGQGVAEEIGSAL